MESEWSRGGSFSDGFDFNDPPDSVSATTISVCKKKPRQNGDEAANRHDSNWTMDCSAVRLKTLRISSHILPFFYKLSSHGMSESERTHVRIKLSGNTLNITAAPALLDVLMAADKFEASSCMNYCRQLLRNSPMTLDSALLYLEFPQTDAFQPLTHAAKQYLVDRYKGITKFKEEVMTLPLSGIDAILASDDLQVESEDHVYDIVLMWVRKHYNGLQERQEVLGKRLARLIRFPYMTCQKLEKVLTCDDFAHNDALIFELVLEALLLKAEAQQSLTTYALNCRFVERAYKYLYVKVVEFELPRQQCVVYLDLKRKECATLFPFGRMKTQTFYLGGQRFFLGPACGIRDATHNFPCFKLAVGMMKNYSGSFVVDGEFAVRSRPEKEFVVKSKLHNYTFSGGTYVCGDVFGVSWTEFIAENSPFFINDVLHLKVELSIKP